MNIRDQLWKLRHGPICCFGGSSDQNTTNRSENYDNRSITTITNTLDGGAVSGALDTVKNAIGMATQVVTGDQANVVHAYDYADGLFHAGLDAVNKGNSRAFDAFDRAAQIENDSLLMVGKAGQTAFDQIQNAYADAKGTTQAQQKIMLAVLLVAAVAVIAVARKG